jgi:hypothetical protein
MGEDHAQGETQVVCHSGAYGNPGRQVPPFITNLALGWIGYSLPQLES